MFKRARPLSTGKMVDTIKGSQVAKRVCKKGVNTIIKAKLDKDGSLIFYDSHCSE